jgi:hypothetical protein
MNMRELFIFSAANITAGIITVVLVLIFSLVTPSEKAFAGALCITIYFLILGIAYRFLDGRTLE